jgi:hypothetical protein
MLRHSVKKTQPSNADKLFWILFSRFVVDWRNNLIGLHPDTIVRCQGQDIRIYWRWKSHSRKPGRPAIDTKLCKLIRQMQAANMAWGVPRIHGELLKLGIEVSQATVSNYMLHFKRPLSQSWRIFLSNHGPSLTMAKPICERVIGSIRRDCLDHVIIINQQYLRRILRKYLSYCPICRTHLSLNKDPPESRTVELPGKGKLVALPRVGGLHHRYARLPS